MTTNSRRKRPFGVTVIIFLQVIAFTSLAIDLYLDGTITAIPLFPTVQESVLLGAMSVFVLGYQLVVAVGLWQLKRWAWFLLMIQLGFGLGFGLWFYFNSTPLYYYMVFNVIMVFYLNQRDVQRAFEHATNSREVDDWTT